MEIKMAENAGFCFGVERAVKKVYDKAAEGVKVYTYGPIIHNEVVVKDLEEKGVTVIRNEEELERLDGGVVIIRSHGVGKRVYEILARNKIEIVDATCPFVKKIHKIVEMQSLEGKLIIVVGNKLHPEVQGIVSWSHGPVHVVETPEDIDNLSISLQSKLCIVAQTTFNYNKFQVIVEKFSENGYDYYVADTICNATYERQSEAKQIAAQVDAMIVIGGKISSNTQKLYEICSSECEKTYYIQTLADLNPEDFQFVNSVGVTAGASTPNSIIEEVHTHVRSKF